MVERGVDLLLFAGGDGTATDVHSEVGGDLPILGVPSGVKMHSAVFAVSPRAAGEAVRNFVENPDAAPVGDAEILDRPAPDAAPELLGYVKTLGLPQFIQHGKAAAAIGSIDGACDQAVDDIRAEEGLVLIGAGMTMRHIKQALGFDGTLLGVDAVRNGEPVGEDLTAGAILELIEAEPEARPLLVVGIVGGQGFLFGRGNQQLSAEVLKRIGRERIEIVSSMEKILALPSRRLWIDTGDDAVDELLSGYLPVTVGFRYTTQLKVGPPEIAAEAS
jgi:predicted polyphosphate/ATP-dependent NAD kinase